MSTHRIDLAPVFRRAAVVIRQDGWCQGAFAAGAAVDVVEAVRRAATVDGVRDGDAVDTAVALLAVQVDPLVINADPIERVAGWNDQPSRTLGEVVGALEQVAVGLDRERAEGRAAEQRHQLLDAAVPPLACPAPQAVRPILAQRADLAIRTDVFGTPYLRADRVRRDTLVQLAATWREDSAAVIDVLDALAEVVGCPRDSEGAEVDAAVEDVEVVCDMGPAEMELRRADLIQLIGQALDAHRASGPWAGRPIAAPAGSGLRRSA